MFGKIIRKTLSHCKSTISIDGKTITITGNYKDISVKNGVIYVDGKPYKDGDSKKYEVVKVIVNGDVGNIDATSVEVNGNVKGSIDGTEVTVSGSVGGDIDGTNVIVRGNVNGNIDANIVEK